MLTKKRLIEHLNLVGISLDGNGDVNVRIHNDRLFFKMMTDSSLAAGEGYVDGWWDCDKLDELFYRLCRSNLDTAIYGEWYIAFYSFFNRLLNFQSRSRSKQVADLHYNIGNDFYRDMLGKTMAYTCGYWHGTEDLDTAQTNKFELVCRKLHLRPNEKVLDLGCGWGGLSAYMAKNYGCEVTAVNISTEQVKYAQEHVKGLPVSVFLCDYRDVSAYNSSNKPFDKIVSIGLCEHVGHKNYRKFFQIVQNQLKEDGLFLLHTIGKNDSFPYVNSWTNKYIFPNGMLPSASLLANALEGLFVLEDWHNFGSDYDKTLMAWNKNFIACWPKYAEQYGERFFRLWNYYLLSSAGGFRARAMQLWQLVLSPKGVLGGYDSQR